jgi:hypothetical protein
MPANTSEIIHPACELALLLVWKAGRFPRPKAAKLVTVVFISLSTSCK